MQRCLQGALGPRPPRMFGRSISSIPWILMIVTACCPCGSAVARPADEQAKTASAVSDGKSSDGKKVTDQKTSKVGQKLTARQRKDRQKRRAGLELFEKKIRPALIEHCYECHSADADDVGGGLLVDSRQGLIGGGDSGSSLRPGKPEASLVLQAIEYRDLEMPPDEKLPDELVASFRRWISLGAPDPRKSAGAKTADSDSESASAKMPLWSIQPIVSVQPPDDPSGWAESGLDRWIGARQRAGGVVPNGDADAGTLIRRLYFDLIGLPPSPDQIRAFTQDPSPTRYAAVVDKLLSSEAYGQRWARHWLDVARYGESAGSSRDVLMLYAWRYRDYVIDAFNADLPYDQFITEQIAGDLLSSDTAALAERRLVATGLLAIGSKSLNGGNLVYDVIDDQIDVISKSMLGLTVSCARCHDHKFDPIPTADYYAMAGIFLSTETRYGGGIKRPNNDKARADVYLSLGAGLDDETAAQREKASRQVQSLTKQVQSSRKRVASLKQSVPKAYQEQLGKEIDSGLTAKQQQTIRQYQTAHRVLGERLQKLADAKQALKQFPVPQYAIGVRDAKKIADANVLVRGEKDEKGPVAPRGFLSAVELGRPADGPAGTVGQSQSGRLQLANWLTHPDHPLTARVAVNRIWQHLMGQGIVPTSDNFGHSGLPPSHPELLDHLARRFVDQYGWSRKKLIREIVLSKTYRLSSMDQPSASEKDPDNQLRWRMDRRRLEAEPLRDAVLSVGGLLDTDPLDGSLVMQIGEGEVGRNIDVSVLEKPFDHRAIYLPIIRGIIPEELKLFDFPEPSNVQGQRDSSTTPKQSLFLMNSPLVLRGSLGFATSLLEDPSLSDDSERLKVAFLRCFGRTPTREQSERALAFIADQVSSGTSDAAELDAWTTFCQTLIASAPFRFVD